MIQFLSDIFSSAIVQIFQWLVLIAIAAYLHVRGVELKSLKTEELPKLVAQIMKLAPELDAEARQRFKDILIDLRNTIREHGVGSKKEGSLEEFRTRISEFRVDHNKKIEKIPNALAMYGKFEQSFSYFLTAVYAAGNASPKLKRQFSELRREYAALFDVLFHHEILTPQEREDLGSLSIKMESPPSQSFWARLFGSRPSRIG